MTPTPVDFWTIDVITNQMTFGLVLLLLCSTGIVSLVAFLLNGGTTRRRR